MDETAVRESQLAYRNATTQILNNRTTSLYDGFTDWAVVNAREKFNRALHTDLRGE